MAIQIRRREFVATLGGAAAWPLAAHAQQPAMPVVGFLSPGSAAAFSSRTDAFRRGLNETGYTEGRDVAIEYRWADGHFDHLPALVADLVQRRVTVLAVGGGPAPALAAKAATSEIPILIVTGDDPVKYGLVASLNRPGGNITGAAFFSTTLAAKRLELVRQLVPASDGVALLVNPNNVESVNEARDLKAAAQAVGQQTTVLRAGNASELDAVFADVAQPRIKAILVGSDAFFVVLRDQLVALAARYAVPTMYPIREFVVTGGLVSYGNSIPDAYRQIGLYAGRILKGEKPADLPVAQPTKFELVINLKTAKALDLTIPPGILAIADEVIE
jgi:putative tryptophan/tyrosine transport system substrate-binding protein